LGSAGWLSAVDFDVTSAPIASGKSTGVTPPSALVPFLSVSVAPMTMIAGDVPAHEGKVLGSVR
jgi:hypothetical protein